MPPKPATEEICTACTGPVQAAVEQLQPGVDRISHDSIYADMSNGLHALAQPLTVMRTAMAAATLPGTAPDRQRFYLDISQQQVERACILFHWLQQLVTAREIEADRGPIDLQAMLTPVIEGERAALASAGVAIEAEIPGDLRPVLADMDRTLEALYAVLKIAGSISSPGDAIDLSVESEQDFIALSLCNRRSHQKRLTSSDRLSLSLAEANIRSQGGHFECAENPFYVSFTLPLDRENDANENDANEEQAGITETEEAQTLQCH